MAMASGCGVFGSSPWKVASNHCGVSPSSLLSSDSVQVRTECTNSASSSSSSTTSTSSTSRASEILTSSGRIGLRQHHGSILMQRRRMRVQIAAEAGEREEPRESVSERWSLEELDEQLKVFSARESSLPRQAPVPRQVPGESEKQKALNESWAKLQWPEFTPGFFLYLSILLVLLTIVDNVLFKFVLHPPVVDRTEVFKSTVPVQPRYRVTTRQEERQAREAEEAQQEAIAAKSREAPLPSE